MPPTLPRAILALLIPALLTLLPGAHLAAEDIAYRPSTAFGLMADDRLEWPEGIAFDSSGNLYIADSGLTVIHKYDASGNLVDRQGNVIQNGVNLRLTAPAGVAVGTNGDLYVVDTAQRTVRIFDSTGAYKSSFGSEGVSDGQFQAPAGIAADASGNLYVTDRDGNRVQKFDATGRFLARWGDRGRENGQFLGPTGIAVDAFGSIYVADTRNHRVQQFDSGGGLLAVWGSQGVGPGEFTEPRGIAVDASGSIYVADTGNRRIQKFSSVGSHAASWASAAVWLAVDGSGNVVGSNGTDARIEYYTPDGSLVTTHGQRGTRDGELRFPRGVWVDGNGNVTVADTGNNRVQQFNADGSFLRAFGSAGSGDGQFRSPSSVAADSSGNLYVADTGNHRIQKFDSGGQFVASFGGPGTGDGQFDRPLAVAVDSGNAVYVADTGNHRIQKFDSGGRFVAKWGSAGLGDGQFMNPTGLAVDLGGNVYVADLATAEGGAPRVQRFDSGARFLSKWVSDGTGDLNPYGIALTRSGQIFISERRRISIPFAQSGVDAVVKLDVGGSFLQRFGTGGTGMDELGKPAGIGVDAGGNVYVADEDNGRVLKLVPVAAPPTPTPALPPIQTPVPGGPVTPGQPPGLPPLPPLPPGPPTPPPVQFGAPALTEPPSGFRLPGPFTTLKWDQPFSTTQFHVQVIPIYGDGPALDLIIGDRGLVGQSRWTLHQTTVGRGPYLLLPDQTYTWRVRASESPEPQDAAGDQWGPWSATWTFRTPRTSPAGLKQAAPPDGAVIPASTVRLSWDNSASEVFYYEVQVSPDPAFAAEPGQATAAVWWNLVHGGLTTPLNSWMTPALEPGRTYYWRVRPRIQGDGEALPWSPTWRFTASVSAPLPAPVAPLPLVGQPGTPGAPNTPAPPGPEPTPPPVFTLLSSAFQDGGTLPSWATCDGQNISPPLEWRNAPPDARSFAVIMDDLDGPGGTFTHWVVFNLPGAINGLDPDVPPLELLENGALQGLNDAGSVGYEGPCPPSGPAHRYRFTVYALDQSLRLPLRSSKADVLAAMQNRILAEVQLTGSYER